MPPTVEPTTTTTLRVLLFKGMECRREWGVRTPFRCCTFDGSTVTAAANLPPQVLEVPITHKEAHCSACFDLCEKSFESGAKLLSGGVRFGLCTSVLHAHM